MTLPNNEQLQKLLRKSTPAPWKVTMEPYKAAEDLGNHGETVLVQLGPFEHVEDAGQHFICTGTDSDIKIAALAPYLAREVIRLRKGMDKLNTIYEQCRKTPPYPATKTDT